MMSVQNVPMRITSLRKEAKRDPAAFAPKMHQRAGLGANFRGSCNCIILDMATDGACGTGGMLTVAQDRLLTIARQYGKNVSIHLFGQEVNPETYASARRICCSKVMGNRRNISVMALRFPWTETPQGSLISCCPIRLTGKAGRLTQKRWAAKRKFWIPGLMPILKVENRWP